MGAVSSARGPETLGGSGEDIFESRADVNNDALGRTGERRRTGCDASTCSFTVNASTPPFMVTSRDAAYPAGPRGVVCLSAQAPRATCRL